MTEPLKEAVAIAREMDPKAQDRLARIMLAASENEPQVPMPQEATPEEVASLAASIAQADIGKRVSDEEMEVLFAEFGA